MSFIISIRDVGVAIAMGINLASHVRRSVKDGINPVSLGDLAHILHYRKSKRLH
jgi:hypothetical protein